MKWKLLDIVTMMLLLPLLLSLSIFIVIYWVGYFPIWWVNRALKTRKMGIKWRDIDVV